MNLIDIFIEFMDQVYYPGYAVELAGMDPAKYNFEWNEFLSNYEN